MDLHSRATRLAADGEKVHDANWIPGEEARDDVVYLRSCDGGRTEIVVVDGNFKGGCTDSGQEYVVDVVDAPIRALKMRDLGRGRVAFAVVGLVSTDGKLFNDEAGKKDGKSTIRVFDDFRVRTVSHPRRSQILWALLTHRTVEHLREAPKVHYLVLRPRPIFLLLQQEMDTHRPPRPPRPPSTPRCARGYVCRRPLYCSRQLRRLQGRDCLHPRVCRHY